jgi:GT2 family glycosyltransferase
MSFLPGIEPIRLAAAAAVRFTREHGLGRALRLALVGASTIGPRGVVRRAAAEVRLREDDERYQGWRPRRVPDQHALDQLRADMTGWAVRPRISLITAVFNTDPAWLRRCVESVRQQVYENWELCVCDDGSTRPETIAVLEEVAADARIRVVRSALNGGIVRASNAALALATGEFIGLVDHDDELAPHALAEVVRCLNTDSTLDAIYTDEDKIDSAGTHSQPHFKPDWSPELLRSCMYVSHFTVMRRSLVEALGAFRPGTDGAQDYDLMLRLMERTSRVAHVPQVLYHWRMLTGSSASSQLGKPWAVAAGQKALETHLERQSIAANVTSGEAAGHYIVRYAKPVSPRVAVVSSPAGVHATSHAGCDFFMLTEPGVRVPDGCLEGLLGLAQQDGIGAVGGIVLFPDGTIESAGLALGSTGALLPMFRGEPSWTRGHLSNILDVRNCTALSSACFMTSRRALEAAGGFDESAGDLFAVDYCLRLRRAGLRVAVTPHVTVRRSTSKIAESGAAAIQRLRSTWGPLLERDPYYNPNFDQTAATFRLPPS